MKKKPNTNQVSTKKDISIIEQVMKVVFKNLRKEILKVEARVENLEDGQKRLETKVDRIENKLDEFFGGVEALKQENSVARINIESMISD